MAPVPQLISAAECLDEFFADRRRGAVGDRLRRIDRAELALRACVERCGDLVLTESEQLLLGAERQFGWEGAVGRVMPADGLLLVLDLYIQQLSRRPVSSVERRAELDTCSALCRHLVRELKHLDIAPIVERIALSLRTCSTELDRAEARGRRRGLFGLRSA